MPIATKNNAIIVKDGKVAENCDCCGGWYCCPRNNASRLSCSAHDLFRNVTVHVETGDDYVIKQYSVNRPCFGGTFSVRGVFIVPSSHYAGTFSLAPAGINADTGLASWSYDYQPDGAGCVASLVLQAAPLSTYMTRWSWSLSLRYRSYGWVKFGPTLPPGTKSLSDMKCQDQTTGSTNNCYAQGLEGYTSSAPSVGGYGQDTPCSRIETHVYTASMAAGRLSLSSDEKDPGGFIITESETGSLDVRMTLTMESP